jgi:hypothetical protein
MKAAGLPDEVINKNIDNVVKNAAPGTNNSPLRRTGKPEYRIPKSAIDKAKEEAAEIAAKKAAKAAIKTGGNLGKKIPGIGTGVAIMMWGSDVQAKGVVAGTANTIMDGIPVFSWFKSGVEIFTGDWFPDLPDEK